MTYPTSAASAAIPDPPDKPTATPIAKMIGKFTKILRPICNIPALIASTVPFCKKVQLSAKGPVSAAPSPSKIPAAGNKATGTMSAFPNF